MSRLPMSCGFSFSLSGSVFLMGSGFGVSLFFSLSRAKIDAGPTSINNAKAAAATRLDASPLYFIMRSLQLYLSRLFVDSRLGDAPRRPTLHWKRAALVRLVLDLLA